MFALFLQEYKDDNVTSDIEHKDMYNKAADFPQSMMFTAGKPGWHNGASFFQLALRRSRSRVTNHNKNKTGASSYLRGSRSFYY